MNNLFNPDNKFFTSMGKVADFMILNFICIICCLPIITAGASITAMYYMTLKMARNEETYIVKGFFHSFRENLKQSTIIHVIMLLIGIILAFDFYFTRIMRGQGTFYTVLTYVFMLGIIVYLMVLTYIYPVLAKFYNSVKQTFRNALLMSIRHLPSTILMIAITASPVILMLVVGPSFPYVMMFYCLMGFAVMSYINSLFLVKIFDRYIPQTSEEEDSNEPKEIDTSVFTNLQPTEGAWDEPEETDVTDDVTDSDEN